MRVRLTLSVGQNILSAVDDSTQPGGIRRSVGSLLDGDLVWISDIVNSPLSPLASPPVEMGSYYIAQSYPDPVTQEINWRFRGPLGPGYSSTAHEYSIVIERVGSPGQAFRERQDSRRHHDRDGDARQAKATWRRSSTTTWL